MDEYQQKLYLKRIKKLSKNQPFKTVLDIFMHYAFYVAKKEGFQEIKLKSDLTIKYT